jgi:hypothetical protein
MHYTFPKDSSAGIYYCSLGAIRQKFSSKRLLSAKLYLPASDQYVYAVQNHDRDLLCQRLNSNEQAIQCLPTSDPSLWLLVNPKRPGKLRSVLKHHIAHEIGYANRDSMQVVEWCKEQSEIFPYPIRIGLHELGDYIAPPDLGTIRVALLGDPPKNLRYYLRINGHPVRFQHACVWVGEPGHHKWTRKNLLTILEKVVPLASGQAWAVLKSDSPYYSEALKIAKYPFVQVVKSSHSDIRIWTERATIQYYGASERHFEPSTVEYQKRWDVGAFYFRFWKSKYSVKNLSYGQEGYLHPHTINNQLCAGNYEIAILDALYHQRYALALNMLWVIAQHINGHSVANLPQFK